MRTLAGLLLLLLSASVFAGIGVYEFDNPEQEARFKRMSEELRCLVCQNQNLADSNAELALDLRRELQGMIRAGKSDDEIIGFMTDRYGDFVLYRPPVKTRTLLLWAGPFLLLVLGVVVLARLVRQRTGADDEARLSEAERQRLEKVLHQGGAKE